MNLQVSRSRRNNTDRSKSDSRAIVLFIGLVIFSLEGHLAANEIVVDATASGGGNGSAERPFQKIQQGIDLAQPGDTVTVHKGTYPEQITIKNSGTADQPIVLRAEPIHSVIVDGADALTGFQEDATHATTDKTKVWVLNGYKSPYTPMDNSYNLREDWIKEGEEGKQQVELVSRNDMVWLDGQFLEQVDAPEQLHFGTFWVDRQKGELCVPLVATDHPESHLIEAAQRGTLLQGPEASFIHVRGFHFTRAAGHDPVMRMGGLKTGGWVIEDNVADWGSWNGFGLYGKNNQVLRNIAAHNGCEGMSGILHDTLLDGNSSLHNNWKAIRDTYESGGGKFTECDHVTVRNHLAAYNIGPGLWFDINNTNITVENSRFHNNKYAGLFMEIAPGPTLIRGNVCYSNQGGGIVIGESNNVTIENNILAANWYGIDLRSLHDRYGMFGSDKKSPADHLWQISDVSIHHNVFYKNTRAGIGNTNNYFDPTAERITSDNNTFWGNHFYYWQMPNPKGPYAKVPKPSQTVTTIDNAWIMDGSHPGAFHGLDAHSVSKDPDYPNGDMFEFPDPDQLVETVQKSDHSTIEK